MRKCTPGGLAAKRPVYACCARLRASASCSTSKFGPGTHWIGTLTSHGPTRTQLAAGEEESSTAHAELPKILQILGGRAQYFDPTNSLANISMKQCPFGL